MPTVAEVHAEFPCSRRSRRVLGRVIFECEFAVDEQVVGDVLPERSAALLRLVHETWHERSRARIQGSMI